MKKPAVCLEMTETEIVAKAQTGDIACFELLYARHKKRIFTLCYRMTRNYSEAEDFTQETFLQLYRKIALFRGEAAFSTWLHRMAVNIVLMHFRKKGIIETSLHEILDPQEEGTLTRQFGKRDDTLHDVVDRITMGRALDDLSPGYRCVFVLHDVEGYEHNEIAEMLGCSIGNSKSQLHKARMKLRTLLPEKKIMEKKIMIRTVEQIAA
jgi:RNA polymerase sigma-70 factor (ECF subfamily)